MGSHQRRGIYLTAEEASKLLRVTPRTLYQWLRDGKLKGRKIGRTWRILRTMLERV